MELHGLLRVDKPPDMTSHDVVAILRKRLKQKRIGHTGTLDPIATGLMVVVMGEATKLSDYLISEDKAYSVTVRFGLETDTLDRSGMVLRTSEKTVTREELSTALKELTGKFEWQVPMYSAVKVDGKPLHKSARQNEVVEAPVKEMSFWNVLMKEFSGTEAQIELDCSKGSFIRTWVQKLGERLGSGAVVNELRRLRVGSWTLDRALDLADLENFDVSQADRDLKDAFIPVGESLPGYRAVVVDERDARLMLNGQIPKDVAARLIPEQKAAFQAQEPVYVKVMSGNGDLLAMVAAQPGQGLKIRRVFRFS